MRPNCQHDPVRQGLDALAVGDVGADRDRARPGVRRDLSAGLIHVGDHDDRALGGELPGDRPTDPLASPGHDSDLVVQPAH
jgi:hypothetical protein